MKDKITLICKCMSSEHQVSFWHDEEDDELYCEPHLVNHNSFIRRIVVAIKYIFGYTSKYGQWDCTIFKDEDLKKLKEYLEN